MLFRLYYIHLLFRYFQQFSCEICLNQNMAEAMDDINFMQDSDGYYTEPCPRYSLRCQQEIWRLKCASANRCQGVGFSIGFEDKSVYQGGSRSFEWIISVCFYMLSRFKVIRFQLTYSISFLYRLLASIFPLISIPFFK